MRMSVPSSSPTQSWRAMRSGLSRLMSVASPAANSSISWPTSRRAVALVATDAARSRTASSSPGAEPHLGLSQRVGAVLDRDRDGEPFVEHLPQRDVGPAEGLSRARSDSASGRRSPMHRPRRRAGRRGRSGRRSVRHRSVEGRGPGVVRPPRVRLVDLGVGPGCSRSRTCRTHLDTEAVVLNESAGEQATLF
jgi:hypothetical protein